MKIDRQFFVGEYGYGLEITTGVDMTNLGPDDVKVVYRRSDGSEVIQNIPSGDRVDPATGKVQAILPSGVFNVTGTYMLQIYIKLAAGMTVNAPTEFEVRTGAAADPATVFA